MEVASVFSGGFGSMSYALKQSNIKHNTVFICEIMKPQRESYLLNHETPEYVYVDILTTNFLEHRGKIDLLQLSPPCQSYSSSGLRKGADSDKGQLMFESIRVIDTIQPKMFIFVLY